MEQKQETEVQGWLLYQGRLVERRKRKSRGRGKELVVVRITLSSGVVCLTVASFWSLDQFVLAQAQCRVRIALLLSVVTTHKVARYLTPRISLELSAHTTMGLGPVSPNHPKTQSWGSYARLIEYRRHIAGNAGYIEPLRDAAGAKP